MQSDTGVTASVPVWTDRREGSGTVLVFGATGQQGKWVCKAFSEAGWTVVGVSRSVDRVPEGCHRVVKADLTDAASVTKACEGVDVVFGLTQPWRANGSVDEMLEKRQAEGLIEGVAAAKNVRHFIYTSVMSLARWEMEEATKQMAHLRQKWVVNRRAEELGVPMTMLGPSAFMDNWKSPFASVTMGQINGLCTAETKMPQVACRDIGRMAVVAAKMGPPAKGERRYLPVVTESVSGVDMQKMFAKWHGRKFSYAAPPMFVLKLFAHEAAEMKAAFELLGNDPCPVPEARKELEAQIEETRRLLGGDYWTLERWLIENGMDKHLPPTPTPVWQKALLVGAAIGAAVIAWWWLK